MAKHHNAYAKRQREPLKTQEAEAQIGAGGGRVGPTMRPVPTRTVAVSASRRGGGSAAGSKSPYERSPARALNASLPANEHRMVTVPTTPWPPHVSTGRQGLIRRHSCGLPLKYAVRFAVDVSRRGHTLAKGFGAGVALS